MLGKGLALGLGVGLGLGLGMGVGRELGLGLGLGLGAGDGDAARVGAAGAVAGRGGVPPQAPSAVTAAMTSIRATGGRDMPNDRVREVVCARVLRSVAFWRNLPPALCLLAAACGSATPAAAPSPTAPPTPSLSASPGATPAPAPSTGLAQITAPAATPAPGPQTSPSPTACPATLAGQLADPGSGTQLVTVDAPSDGATAAAVALWQRTGRCWSLVAGPWAGRVGATGVSDHHREGDGSTPSGAYGFGPVMYGIAADPGVRYGYHRLVCGDWWDEDPASPTYNTFQHVACGSVPPFHGRSEALWEATTPYQRFAVVGYNAGPVVAGAGSAVFVHDATGGPTIGCVSVAAADLDRLLVWLDPRRSPTIVIGTEAEIRRF